MVRPVCRREAADRPTHGPPSAAQPTATDRLRRTSAPLGSRLGNFPRCSRLPRLRRVRASTPRASLRSERGRAAHLAAQARARPASSLPRRPLHALANPGCEPAGRPSSQPARAQGAPVGRRAAAQAAAARPRRVAGVMAAQPTAGVLTELHGMVQGSSTSLFFRLAPRHMTDLRSSSLPGWPDARRTCAVPFAH